MTDRPRVLAVLQRAAEARARAASLATPLGLRFGSESSPPSATDFDDDTTEPARTADPRSALDASDREPTPLPPPPAPNVALAHDVRLDSQSSRLRERLGAVFPAMVRLESEVARASVRIDRPLIELALADVQRALFHARRSVRALVAELADLEREAHALGQRAADVVGDEGSDR